MRIAANIIGALLGLLFITFGLNFFLHFIPMPPLPGADTPAGQFMAATGATGYLAFVHALEVLGGIFLLIPTTRAFAMLVIGPIVVNILCFHTFITHGEGLVPVPLTVAVLTLFLLLADRARYALLFINPREGEAVATAYVPPASEPHTAQIPPSRVRPAH